MFFFFNDTATTEIYTLSLHDALPIWRRSKPLREHQRATPEHPARHRAHAVLPAHYHPRALFPAAGLPSCHCAHKATRSEEHTSELQSQSNLVCRLLLEKKKKNTTIMYIAWDTCEFSNCEIIPIW